MLVLDTAFASSSEHVDPLENQVMFEHYVDYQLMGNIVR